MTETRCICGHSLKDHSLDGCNAMVATSFGDYDDNYSTLCSCREFRARQNSLSLHRIQSADEMAAEIDARVKQMGRPGHILALLVIVGVIVAVTIAMKILGPSIGLQPGVSP